jgi:hypothetical protein
MILLLLFLSVVQGFQPERPNDVNRATTGKKLQSNSKMFEYKIGLGYCLGLTLLLA